MNIWSEKLVKAARVPTRKPLLTTDDVVEVYEAAQAQVATLVRYEAPEVGFQLGSTGLVWLVPSEQPNDETVETVERIFEVVGVEEMAQRIIDRQERVTNEHGEVALDDTWRQAAMQSYAQQPTGRKGYMIRLAGQYHNPESILFHQKFGSFLAFKQTKAALVVVGNNRKNLLDAVNRAVWMRDEPRVEEIRFTCP